MAQTDSTLGRYDVVSCEDEPLILVDERDQPVGSLAKSACHDGGGVLHRAFSLFVFNAAGETLLQRRHPSKRLWPGYWANSCCSHPRVGEDTLAAVRRRAEDELGLTIRAEFLFKFQYRAAFAEEGTEFELCSVYIGRIAAGAAPRINRAEIAEWRWVGAAALDQEMRQAPDTFAPWLKLEWRRLRDEFQNRIGPMP